MDDEILKTVESMLGKNVKIVDCEKTSTTREEEVLLINGIPITIEGADSVAIKNALITGEVPSCELLNQLLFRAGILRQPVHLETSLSVKSTLVTKEEVTVARGGCILDEKSTETKEDTFYTSSCKEIWEPIKMVTCLPPSIEASAGTTPENRPASAIPYRDPAFPIDSNGDLHTVSSVNSTYLSSQPNSTTSICDSLSDCCDKLRHRKSVEENCRKPLQQQADKLPDPQHQQQSHSHQQKQPNASYDSGNDDVFSSQLLDTPNSISSGFELSLDETDFLKTDSTTIPVFIKRKPQQSIEQPSQQQHSMSVTSNIQQMNVLKKKQITKNSDSSCSSTSSSDVLHTGGDTMNSDIGDINDSSKNGGDFDENVLVYRDSSLISGSLSALIQHMVPTSTYYPDRSYIFAFLLSARLFIRPQELLEKIGQISDEQQHLDTCNIDAMSCNFVQRLIQVLAEWMTTFPYDFRDERIMISIRKLTRKCQQIDKKLEDTIARMLQNLSKILEELNQYEQFLENINQRIDFLDDRHDSYTGSSTGSSNSVSQQHNYHPHHNHHQQQQQQQQQHHHQQQQYSNNPPYPTSSDITDICSNPTQLAHQLTHIELERLSHIGPEEFVQAFVKDNPHIDPLMSDTKKTRNLESYVQWFNRLSYFVASEIVKHSKKKQRIRVIEYWIEAARECFNIGNFNSLMAIIAGLNMSPISRLKKTWAKVQSAKFLVLEHQMDPSSNFNSYRSTLKAAMWRSAGATDERERIVIPFFSLLVKDLYFLNEGCSNRLPNGYINFEKFWQLAKQVNEFIAWKQVTCPFPKLTKIATFLQTNLVLNENSLALASFECEPPDNNHEKDRYKSLKSEQNTLDKS